MNALPFNVLRVLSESPDEPCIKAFIQRKVGSPEGGELQSCLKALERNHCVEYTPKEKSRIGHDTYRITEDGRDELSYFYNKDRLAKTMRDLLGLPEVEEQVIMSIYE